MENRIIQLELSKQKTIDNPLDVFDLIATDNENIAFLGEVTNYVSDDLCIVENEAENLKNYLKHKSKNDLFEINNFESITFKKGFKESYFKRRFDDFKNISKKFTMKDFLDLYEVSRLNSILSTQGSIYIYTENEDMHLDVFIRRLPDEDVTYYFGNILEFY